jgi:hypothetical protein
MVIAFREKVILIFLPQAASEVANITKNLLTKDQLSAISMSLKRRIWSISLEQRRGKNKDASRITEITNLIGFKEFEEKQIIERNTTIIDKFFEFLQREDLIA